MNEAEASMGAEDLIQGLVLASAQWQKPEARPQKFVRTYTEKKTLVAEIVQSEEGRHNKKIP